MLHNFPIGFKWGFVDGKNVVLLSLLIEHKILGRDEVLTISPIEAIILGPEKAVVYRSKSVRSEGETWLRICGLVVGK